MLGILLEVEMKSSLGGKVLLALVAIGRLGSIVPTVDVANVATDLVVLELQIDDPTLRIVQTSDDSCDGFDIDVRMIRSLMICQTRVRPSDRSTITLGGDGDRRNTRRADHINSKKENGNFDQKKVKHQSRELRIDKGRLHVGGELKES